MWQRAQMFVGGYFIHVSVDEQTLRWEWTPRWAREENAPTVYGYTGTLSVSTRLERPGKLVCQQGSGGSLSEPPLRGIWAGRTLVKKSPIAAESGFSPVTGAPMARHGRRSRKRRRRRTCFVSSGIEAGRRRARRSGAVRYE